LVIVATHRGSEGERGRLESRLRSVVIILTLDDAHVQVDPRLKREGLKEVREILGRDLPEILTLKPQADRGPWSSREVDNRAGERFIERGVRRPKSLEPTSVSERLSQRLAEGERAVFCGVMIINMSVTLTGDRQIKARVPREAEEHMVEEADAGRDLTSTLAVEGKRELDLGLSRDS
jgi:hypothetical protein